MVCLKTMIPILVLIETILFLFSVIKLWILLDMTGKRVTSRDPGIWDGLQHLLIVTYYY